LTVIVVADQKTAESFIKNTPNAVIAGKVAEHIRETGKSGLVSEIGNALAGGY
jgi:hypothetical protein